MSEQRTIRRQRSIIFGLLIALIFTMTGYAIASASIPDATGQIHGCYSAAGTSTHGLSVIDPAKTAKCPTGTLPLNWNTGGLLYQQTAYFSGPYTSGQTVATFTVPAGLMCVQGTGTVYVSTPNKFAAVAFLASSSVYPSVVLGIMANEANSHKAMVQGKNSVALTECGPVPAGTVTYKGHAITSGAIWTFSDGNDNGSVTVQVYSR